MDIINKTLNTSPPPATPKYIITLKLMLSRDKTGLNQLEAFNVYGETCLHSTVSTLANKYGIEFDREREPHKHRGGGTTHFMRYRIGSSEKALKLLARYLGAQ